MRVDPPDLESALEEIAELRREIDRLTMLVICGDAAVDDLNIQCKFWRQAAEHAVNGWNAIEDRFESAIEAIGYALENGLTLQAWAQLETVLNEATPAEADPSPNQELGEGLYLVEDEKAL